MQTMQTIEGLVETRQMSTRGDAIFAFLTKGGALEKRFLVALFFRRAARLCRWVLPLGRSWLPMC